MDNVTKFYPKDAAKNPDAVLEQAVGEYESVFVIGWDKNGYLDPRASTNLKQEQILWLIETFKMKMLRGDYAEDNNE